MHVLKKTLLRFSHLQLVESSSFTKELFCKTDQIWGKESDLKMSLWLFVLFQVLCLDKSPSSASDPAPSSVQVRKSSSSNPMPQPSVSSDPPKPPSSTSEIPRSATVSAQDMLKRQKQEEPLKSAASIDLVQGVGGKGGGVGKGLAETGRSTSNLAISGSQLYLAGGKEPTPSIASDISNPYAAQELQHRLQQLQKYLSLDLFISTPPDRFWLAYSCRIHSLDWLTPRLYLRSGSGPSHFPLGEIQLTLRHSSQRNKLIVVVHGCRYSLFWKTAWVSGHVLVLTRYFTFTGTW